MPILNFSTVVPPYLSCVHVLTTDKLQMRGQQRKKTTATQPNDNLGHLHHIVVEVVLFMCQQGTSKPPNPSHPQLLLRLDKLNTIIHVTPAAVLLSGSTLTIIMVCLESHSLLLNLQYKKVLLAMSWWDFSSLLPHVEEKNSFSLPCSFYCLT